MIKNKLHYFQREAAFLAVGIDSGVLELEIFKDKAEEAIPILETICQDIAAPDVEERDRYRYDFLQSLIAHIKQVHNIEQCAPRARGAQEANAKGTDS